MQNLKSSISRKIFILDTINVLQAYTNMRILHTNTLFNKVYDYSLWIYDVILTSTYQKSVKIQCSLKTKHNINSKF